MMLETKVQENSFNGPARLGVHYFPDTAHYHAADLQTWLPRLQGLGVRWAVLPAPADRAIPEDFIAGLLAAGIEPILHFKLTLDTAVQAESLQPLFEAYAKWGVRYVVLFDKPNLRSQWPQAGWTQRGLVPRFLELFVPAARAAAAAGLSPVFPPLEPGGDYWDTAFLRGALEELDARGEDAVLDSLTLGAYAWAGDKSLNWGEGGPERWPATLPYSTPENSQDQRGFRIFDWYNAVSAAAIGRSLPIILVAAGGQLAGESDPATMQAIIAALGAVDMPANVIAANLWLLAAEADSVEAKQAWFNGQGDPNPAATELLRAFTFTEVAAHSISEPVTEDIQSEPVPAGSRAHSLPAEAAPKSAPAAAAGSRPIRHYLLLPGADWSLTQASEFISGQQPTIGYSVEEARHAQRVTLAGGLQSFSDELIRDLIQAGCQVELLPAA